MKKKPISWLYELEHDLHPHRLMGHLQKTTDPPRTIDTLETDVRTFKAHFAEWLGSSRTLAKTALQQATATSNTLYTFLTKMALAWNGHDRAVILRNTYRSGLGVLESLLEDCGRLDARLLARLPLTAYSLPATKMQLKKKVKTLLGRLDKMDMDGAVFQILANGQRRITSRKELTRSDVAYAHDLLDRLNSLPTPNTESVEELLYRMDFNSPLFLRPLDGTGQRGHRQCPRSAPPVGNTDRL